MSLAAYLDEKAPILLLGAFLVAFVRIVHIVVKRLSSPIRHLPGPPSNSLLFGHFKQLMVQEAHIPRGWIEQYGPTIRIFGALKVRPKWPPFDVR